MLIDITESALDLLVDLANDEIKSIESGITTYGDRDANMDAIQDLAEFVAATTKAFAESRGW